jgi:hypothetical protein
MNFSLPGQHDFGFYDLMIKGTFYGPKVMLTPEGGFAIRITNCDVGATVKGRVVNADTNGANGVCLTNANDSDAVGVYYETGTPAGEECWVVVAGIADVLMEDNTATTRGYWLRSSITEGGYGNAVTSTPPGGDVAHWTELGHCLETVAAGGAGTHVLAKCILHFN